MVVIKNNSRKNPMYLSDFVTNRQISYTRNFDDALVFDSEEEARIAVGNCWRDIKIVSLDSQIKANKPKPYVLVIGKGKLGGQYLSKTTKNTTYGSFALSCAKRFATEREAIQYVHFMRKRGCDETRYGKFTLENTDNGSCTVLDI